jgi:hypothetical protein
LHFVKLRSDEYACPQAGHLTGCDEGAAASFVVVAAVVLVLVTGSAVCLVDLVSLFLVSLLVIMMT